MTKHSKLIAATFLAVAAIALCGLSAWAYFGAEPAAHAQALSTSRLERDFVEIFLKLSPEEQEAFRHEVERIRRETILREDGRRLVMPR